MAKNYSEYLPDNEAIELIFIEGSSFLMGSNESEDEQPIHEVNIPNFYLSKYPITVGQYMQFVEATNSHHPEWIEEGSDYHIFSGSDNYYKKIESVLQEKSHPIVGISWDDATAYCQWLSEKTGKEYHLPSESEWEYAARGGKYSKGYTYSGSNNLKEVGWYDQNSHGETKMVGLKKANELGLFDMSGNVFEWCADHWHSNYEGAPDDGSPWNSNKDENKRVIRGGSWYGNVNYCRVSYRDWLNHYGRDYLIGFRIARY